MGAVVPTVTEWLPATVPLGSASPASLRMYRLALVTVAFSNTWLRPFLARPMRSRKNEKPKLLADPAPRSVKVTAVVPTVVTVAASTKRRVACVVPPLTLTNELTSISAAVSKSAARVSTHGVPAVPTVVSRYSPLFAAVDSSLTSTRWFSATVTPSCAGNAPLAVAVSVAPTPAVPLL